jgi:hypothetical protein
MFSITLGPEENMNRKYFLLVSLLLYTSAHAEIRTEVLESSSGGTSAVVFSKDPDVISCVGHGANCEIPLYLRDRFPRRTDGFPPEFISPEEYAWMFGYTRVIRVGQGGV